MNVRTYLLGKNKITFTLCLLILTSGALKAGELKSNDNDLVYIEAFGEVFEIPNEYYFHLIQGETLAVIPFNSHLSNDQPASFFLSNRSNSVDLNKIVTDAVRNETIISHRCGLSYFNLGWLFKGENDLIVYDNTQYIFFISNTNKLIDRIMAFKCKKYRSPEQNREFKS